MREWPVNASLLRTLPLSPSVTNFGLISVPKLSENRSALRPVRSRRLFSGFVTLGAFHLQSVELDFLGGGDGIRTHGLYIANVRFTTF